MQLHEHCNEYMGKTVLKYPMVAKLYAQAHGQGEIVAFTLRLHCVRGCTLVADFSGTLRANVLL
jgi:hypothetical protein